MFIKAFECLCQMWLRFIQVFYASTKKSMSLLLNLICVPPAERWGSHSVCICGCFREEFQCFSENNLTVTQYCFMDLKWLDTGNSPSITTQWNSMFNWYWTHYIGKFIFVTIKLIVLDYNAKDIFVCFYFQPYWQQTPAPIKQWNTL